MKVVNIVTKTLGTILAIILVIAFIGFDNDAVTENVQPQPQLSAVELQKQWCGFEAYRLQNEGVTGIMTATNPEVASRVARFNRKCNHLF